MSASQSWFGATPSPLFGASESDRAEALKTLKHAADNCEAARLGKSAETDDTLAQFLTRVMVFSPYLRGAILRFIAQLEKLFDDGVDARLQMLLNTDEGSSIDALTETQLMTQLRELKSEAHMLIALADLAQVFDVAKTTAYLTRLSEVTLQRAIDWLLLDLNDSGKVILQNLDMPSLDSGLVVLGMGKMGGRELNYSSDIDIVIYFELDAEGLKYGENQDPTEVLGRMVRRLVRIMQERTGDGYVFRTDLRLRPDPGATPLAINVDAALNYYESRGQNWERAAFIKARPVAGDLEAGERFIADLKPFIWRKYLDYAAISDVQSIKRQIHAHKGHGRIAVAGHNLKLGRGGIREIEFFVQTQQLIAGGRAVQLRDRSTVEMLSRLCETKWISDDVRLELTQAYEFLRRAEHAVQMIGDEQVHDLPATDEGLTIVAGLLGYEHLDEFKSDTRRTLQTVERHFGELFEDEQALSSKTGNLVFTGEDPDPDTLSNLSAMGFQRPKDMWSVIRTWHFGRYRALQSSTARQQLTAMVPALLESFSQTGQADETVLRFDALIAGLPAGVQLFAMLNSNRHLLSLVTTILSSAPRLADIITKRPLIFDGMLDPAFFESMPNDDDLKARLAEFIGESDSYEDSLDRLRIFAAEQRFLIGVRFLTASIDADTTGLALSNLADQLLRRALKLACEEVVQKHGTIDDAQMCLVAMGKLGSREMTAGSDVDLLLVYDGVDNNVQSKSDKPLAPSQYYARVTQRLIAALSAPTAEGVLYEVDFRLRPSGNKGPLATTLTAFSKYQHNEAWTWEHMALTRARIVCGDAELSEKFDAERDTILCVDRDVGSIAKDIADMRARLRRDKPAKSVWDLKMANGGIVDIEFLAQFWMLTALPNCKPDLTNGNLNFRRAKDILSVSGNAFVSKEDRKTLLDALNVFTLIDHLIKLCSSQAFQPDNAPKGLLEQLCAATNTPNIAQLELHLVDHQNAVAEIFDRILPLKMDG